jgi:hypothetical protein
MRRTRVFGGGVLLLGSLLFAACVQAGTGGGGGDDGGAAGDSGATALTDCTIQTTSGVMLCESLSTCPSVTVSQNTFTQCGFLVVGSAVELECECSGYLCSAGTITTCGVAEQILTQQTSVEVCNQLSAGGCHFEGLSGGSGTGSAGCNTTCMSSCVGDPQCVQACGC